MTHNWKPGDVAVINGHIGIYDGDGFRRPGLPFCHANSINGRGARPLLVIDPEDRGQIERLADVFCHSPSSGWVDQMQAALRLLLEPEPEEPTGLGAVVRDANGFEWARVADDAAKKFWISIQYGRTVWTSWRGIPRPMTMPVDYAEADDDF